MIRPQIWEMGARNKIQREIQVASRIAQRQPSVPRLTCMQSKLNPGLVSYANIHALTSWRGQA